VPHFAAGIAAAARGGRAGALLAAAAALSYELEAGGRAQWLARVMPTGTGTSAVGRVSARGEVRRTLVLVAHLDAAQTGLAWRINERNALNRARGFPGWRPHPDVMASPGTTPKVGFALAALGCANPQGCLAHLRVGGVAALAASALLALEVASNPPVPGASDNATGVAAVLALVERFAAEPLPGTDVVALLPGCEESGMGGMRDWLDAHRSRLDPAATLVLGLDTLGAGEPAVVTGEGPFRPERYPAADLDRADRGAERAGLQPPRRMRLGGWTDPILAVHAGIPSLSIVSAHENRFTNYHLPTDTPDRVDWDSVDACARLASGVAEDFAANGRSVA
jgi:Peptidase family M28